MSPASIARAAPSYLGRFAPSPTGEMHFGSLLVAVGSWIRARSKGGGWLIRIEDLDRARAIPGASERIVRTLAAFGLVSDREIVRQQDDTSRFDAALSTLIAQNAAFACWCTRSDVVAAGGIHRGCTASSSADRAPTYRLRVPPGPVEYLDILHGLQSQDVAREVGEFVLRRANGEFTYHLAVVVDDAWQGITEVVRGGDLADSTARQIVLQRALGVATPQYSHLPMIVDDGGAKLSKRERSAPIDPEAPMVALREALKMLGQFAGEHARTPAELLDATALRFDIAALPRALTLPCPRY